MCKVCLIHTEYYHIPFVLFCKISSYFYMTFYPLPIKIYPASRGSFLALFLACTKSSLGWLVLITDRNLGCRQASLHKCQQSEQLHTCLNAGKKPLLSWVLSLYLFCQWPVTRSLLNTTCTVWCIMFGYVNNNNVLLTS